MFKMSKPACTMPLSAAVVSFGAMAIAAPAMAQDASPWSGFYAGLNAGGAWSTSDADATLTATGTPPAGTPPIVVGDVTLINGANVKGHLGSGHHNTFTGGLEVGYNYVTTSGILLGIETDISFFDIKRRGSRAVTTPNATFTANQEIDTDLLWTFRGRLGYAIDKFLVFGSGGLALTTTDYRLNFTDSRNPSNPLNYKRGNTRTGWTLGGGAGYAFTDRLSAKAEYLYEDFGTSRYSASSSNGYLSLVTDVHLRSHLFRAGLDYRF